MSTANGRSATEPTFWQASKLVKAGYPVFPVKGKEPSVEGGFYACTTDLSQIAEWIEEGRGDHDVAIPTGLPSGVVVIDADTPETYAKMEDQYGGPTVFTRRGGHWWFRHPRNRKVWSNSVEDGLDRKGDGGLVAVPPSRGRTWTNGIPRLEDLPVLPRKFWSKRPREKTDAPRQAPQDRKEAAAEAIAARVARIPQGKRHEHLRHLCGVLLARGTAAGDAEDVLIAAWAKVGGELAERAGREVPNTLRTTEQALVEDRATGVPKMEEITPGLYAELADVFGWRANITHKGRLLGDPGVDGASEQEDTPEGKEERPTQAQLLVRSAAGAELFHTPGGEAFASVPIDKHRETHPIKSKGFRRWLVRGYFSQHDRPPGAQALQDALGVLEARAQFDGLNREVYVHVAGSEGGEAVYVDLANESWEAVEITAGGWRVLPSNRVPVRFRRARGMLALPTPERDGRDGLDDLLRDFINVSDEGAIRLIGAWLVQALRPTGPYPVLLFQGEQGSAKSTAERLVRSLVDPSTAPLRTTPRNERDLVIAATNSWCIAFDNISTLQPWLSDAMCRLSTGGGFSARELYTDAEEVLFDATRPLLLNGITDVATRPDLLDRALVVTLPPIPEEKRRPEAELWREFEKARPRILAALFDAVSGALGAVESVRLEGMPRMADFAVWATAAEDALGWERGAFMDAYTGNREEATESALEADPVAIAVREFMMDRDEWAGTAGELWEALNELVGEGIRHTKAWPGAPNALSGRLKRLAPALRGVSIEYEDVRLSGGERKRVKRLTKNRRTKDRPHRPDRPDGDEISAKQKNPSGTMIASAGRSRDDDTEKTVPNEIPANEHMRDDGDGRDDDLLPHSSLASLLTNRPGWLRNQARKCIEEGSAERLLKPLASSIAAEFLGDVRRWGEALSFVEENLEDLT